MRDTLNWLRTWKFPVAILSSCLVSVVLMIGLTVSSMNGLERYARHTAVEQGQVPHFVCTSDGDGTLLRCVFSSSARLPR